MLGQCFNCKENNKELAGAYRIRERPKIPRPRETAGGWHMACVSCLATKAKQNVAEDNDFYELDDEAKVAIIMAP
jgi:hypothetical protein